MINFRKLKQDFSPTLLKEGRSLHEKKMVVSAKIVNLSANNVRLSCRVQGSYDNHYQNEIEIDRHESTVLDSDCDCPHKYDCQHLAAALFYLEENFNEIVVNFSKENDIGKSKTIDKKEKKKLQESIKEAEIKEVARKGKKYEKELLQEYIGSSQVLGQSPYFLPEEEIQEDQAELAVIFVIPQSNTVPAFEIQLALRLPYRSKPLNVPNIREFIDALRYHEPIYIGSKRYFFTMSSFDADSLKLLKMVMDYARHTDAKNGEATPRLATIEVEAFGTILAEAYDLAVTSLKSQPAAIANGEEQTLVSMPCLYIGSLEEPLRLANSNATLRFELEYLEAPAPKIMLKPTIVHDGVNAIHYEEARLFECAKPGMIHQNIYYRFPTNIKRKHLRHLPVIQNVTIPEPLFGTFVENSLPELLRFSEVTNRDIIDRFVTLPFVGELSAICDINYLNGELDATLHFLYDKIRIPAAPNQLTADNINAFVIPQGILARNLTEEQKIITDIFQGFVFDQTQGVFVAKSDKKIVEFMTDVIPAHQSRVEFNCPENLLDQFVYDDTTFKLSLRETKRIDSYEVELKVDGHLNGVTVNQLWECLSSKKAYIEIAKRRPDKKKGAATAAPATKTHKILVLDLEKLAPVIQIFDELGVGVLDDHREERPLWSLASITPAQFEGLPIEFSMSDKLMTIQQQMLGNVPMEATPIPKVINAELRPYQMEGVHWLQRLRDMHLNGVLADDMGLGKTLQAIIAITQSKLKNPKEISIVVCPTSLVYNWKEELAKFNPKLKALPVDGTPTQRKRLQTDIGNFDIIITSYTLLQKDIEFYKTIPFGYVILDEAQHIKNRSTRNAKSVKMIQAAHRLILTGTPLENSLEELWSLFDFLMPGLLSTYDRFVEKYIRNPSNSNGKNLEALRRKASPFILRRMKSEVLDDLPPISEIVYHCHLSEEQRELYNSYAISAREELAQLVKKEGFDRIHIHVLATLTRLKQICCHPAIFAKEKAEMGDSAKYDMLLELLQNLIGSKHKTVIFSQYTRMLNIMREDLDKLGIKFSYLDGSSKNRLSIVKEFNEDESISVFLVSLKAGGSGLNLVGADTVIHYDMWWNPAVENQATDRVHRMGQKSSVSSYKLITLGTIEEKILELQNRKRGLVKKVIASDEEAISKLTWEEVLELLQT
jgi:SNF2 family DNA or RNA helicase